MSQSIYVINPNSSQFVTAGIDAALSPLRISGAAAIRCLTLVEGPSGIQSQMDIDDVISPLCAQIRKLEADAAAFVIACFSDPGLYSARELTRKPVVGIGECGILTALTMGQRFGVISILQDSIPRHLRYFAAMGVDGRLAGDIAINLGVLELANHSKTLERMIAVGRILREERGADVLVMGCAGMAAFREPLQRELGIPVVEPTQAAVAMAIGRAQLAWESCR